MIKKQDKTLIAINKIFSGMTHVCIAISMVFLLGSMFLTLLYAGGVSERIGILSYRVLIISFVCLVIEKIMRGSQEL